MSGYRRVEPQFCRGCGATWVPGAHACPSCGEVVVRAPPPTGDPRGIAKLRAVLVCASVLLVVRWASFVGAAELAEADAVLALHGVAVAIALATMRWWYPGGAPKSLWKRSTIASVLVALVLAAASAAVFTVTLSDTTEPWMMPTSEVVLWLTDSAWWWIGLAFLTVALEQAFYFGLLFDGIAAISGERNAAIGSALLFGLTVLDPLLVVLGVFSAALRLWSGSVVPAMVLRVAATIGWLAWFAAP